MNDNLVRNNYANELLCYLKANDAIDDGVNVTAQPALSLGRLNNLPFLKVSLNEQDKIIAYVKNIRAKFDALIFNADKFISLSKERRTSLISAAVTGTTSATGNPQNKTQPTRKMPHEPLHA